MQLCPGGACPPAALWARMGVQALGSFSVASHGPQGGSGLSQDLQMEQVVSQALPWNQCGGFSIL